MYHPLIMPDLRVMLAENDAQGLREFCEVLHPATIAEILEDLDTAEVWQVLTNCDLERQAEIFGFLTLSQQVDLVDVVDRQRLSRLIEAMAPDDRVDLLSRMDPDRVENLLPLIARAERSDIRKLLSYPEDSAGAIMTTEYASLPENITVGAALDQLRLQAPDSETIYYVYILDEGRHLQGMTSLRDLILAKPDTLLSEIMHRDVISVRVDDNREFVANELARYDFLVMPVVDNQNRLVGIVTHDDVLDVLQEEATEDAHRQAAVEPLEDSYLETPLFTVVWKRGIWLVLLLVAALVTAAVLDRYKDSSETHVWMVSFIPLILASGGNAGTQSATLVIRTLALGEVSREKNRKVALREIALGLLLGLGLALFGFACAWPLVDFWQHAWIVSLTVALVVLIGTFAGAMLPLIFRNLGMDPALMSNPLIAALVDVFGILIYYNIGVMILESMA